MRHGRDFYAELPISLILSGAYNDLAAFAGDTAALPRIVTLNNIKVRPKDPKNASLLNMDAIAMTYRYLDPDDAAALKKQQNPVARGASDEDLQLLAFGPLCRFPCGVVGVWR